MRIGELAKIAGVSTRAIRHYHSVGVLPEPARRSNGYREYGSKDLLSLVRLVRLAQLGLTLDQIRDALDEQTGHEIRNIFIEIVTDLDAQINELTRRRRSIAEVLSRDVDLVSSPAMASLLDRLRGVVGDQDLVRREQELLEVAEATMPVERFAELAEKYAVLLADPQVIATSRDLAARFERLIDQGPEHPEVLEVAELIASQGAAFTPSNTADGGENTAGWELFLQSLTMAQQHAVTAAAGKWS
ncbi:MerR family transcriptional regulator [Nakamurella antarctica]|uniref:MerR family transcriptional regulator n=1 Tax=Nakamurella antarctica TaxID=1902245 RepID=A0A3G8ZPN7_9ACTN|nr:MerR family transcriptional regulator [Nakamurella antarctica]